MTAPRFQFHADPIRYFSAHAPEREALIYGPRKTSYAQLNSKANRVANALLEDGFGPGARVAYLALNTDRFFVLWQGASRAGIILVPVNFRLSPAEMIYILQHSKAEAVFFGKEFAELMPALSANSDIKHFYSIDDDPGAKEAGHLLWSDWLSGKPDSDPHGEVSEQHTAIQYYSSGTTGHPKGVECSHHGMMAHSDTWLKENGNWNDSERSLVPMPLFHVAGAAYGNAAHSVGACNVILPIPDPGQILQAIQAHGITRVCLVPAVIQAMLAHPQCEQTDFSSLRRVLYGASPMPASLARAAREVLGDCLQQTYGATETGGGFTSLTPEDHHDEELLRSCGKPMAYTEVRVVDRDGQDCAPEEVGEIIVRSTSLMKQYWNAEDATREVLRDGWYYTADMGYFNQEGYLFIHDRKHDMIITGAENVYPAEIENVLLEHPGVMDAGVFGVPCDQWGESVKAAVIPAPGESPGEEELIAFCTERTARFKCPSSIDFVSELPRNATGKILKKELRKPYWEDRERLVN